jgi:DNA polymerase III epsilon subunit-like protein
MELHSLVSKLKELKNTLGETPTREVFLKECKVTDWQLRKHTFKKLIDLSALEIEPKKDIPESVTRAPRILFLDLENSAMIVEAYGLFDQNININDIHEDWLILSYAAKFNDGEKVHYLDQRYSLPLKDDRQLIEGLHYLISQADFICAHNIPFDWGKINARFIKYELEPLFPVCICTLRQARRLGKGFSSKKLEFLARELGVTPKENHSKYPGKKLWQECAKGNMDAWEENEVYNIGDITTLEEIFNKLKRYDPTLNFQAFYQKPTCTCGNHSFFKSHYSYTKQGKFQVYRCHDCGKPHTGKENLIDKDSRKGFFK